MADRNGLPNLIYGFLLLSAVGGTIAVRQTSEQRSRTAESVAADTPRGSAGRIALQTGSGLVD